MYFEESLKLLQPGQPENCPYCGSMDFIKYGKMKSHKQRYLCKNCKKTFSKNTDTPFMYSKKPLKTWLEYVLYMSEGLTLRSISCLLSISLTTAFFWRHKILSAVETRTDTTLTGVIEINELKLKESFKGSKVPEPDYIYYDKMRINMSRNNVFVLSCRDNENNIFIKAVAKMRSTMLHKEHLDNILAPIIKNGKTISTSKNINYTVFARNNKLKLSMTGSNYYIQGINSDRARKQSLLFQRFLRNFRNIASKYTSHYINLFRLMLDEDTDAVEKILSLLPRSKKKLRICDLSKVQYDGSMA
ncbi:MAG: hypothetical protein AB9844_09000 [Clostridiaceae bacterium]